MLKFIKLSKFLIFAVLILTILAFGPKKYWMHHPAKSVILLTYNGYHSEHVNQCKYDWASSYLLEPSRIDIQKRIGHYFDKWDVVVTTDDSLFYTFPLDHRVRCVISSDTLWVHLEYRGWIRAGGISPDIGSMIAGDTNAVIISIPNLSNSNRAIADCVAHEVGHTVGLYHISTWRLSMYGGFDKVDEYERGNTKTAPIMGSSYGSVYAEWTIGLNSNAQLQNDTAIISQTFTRLYK